MKKAKDINIKSDRAVTFHTEGTTAEIRKAMAKAEMLVKTWIESAIDTLGGEIVLKRPISWDDGDGNYITKICRTDSGEVCVGICNLRERPNRQPRHEVSKWAYPNVMTTGLETTDFSWITLYEGLSGEKI